MKLRMVIPALLGAMALAPAASAGQTQPAPVQVDLDNFFAQGDLISARDDKDGDVFIGCGTRSFAGGFEFGFCQAEDADGDRILCNIDDPVLIDAAQSTSDTSFVTFSWADDGFGNMICNRVGTSTQSFYLDKHTMGNTQGKGN
ncbi:MULTISPECIES: hypothetical protein [Henriciella]|jgi:hypothetical protein|uniref:Secreted protein n=1 Tax=Henriciella pelagia TaxID=1977912 RepID=A0ABQ1K053_9PROT|nr:hypothetical protein [Henriciella pelagia]GGB79083.1 hypothetical protein GCM10011503_29930 [Henriciella pelagia]